MARKTRKASTQVTHAPPVPKKLLVWVADRNAEFTVKGVLTRHQSLHIQALQAPHDYDIFNDPGNDPGCLTRVHEALRSQAHRFQFALVLFDRDGCGQEMKSATELEAEVEQRLAQVGLQGRSAAIVLDPELECWVWSRSPHVETVLGWLNRPVGLRAWLEAEGWLQSGELKPQQPKEAMEAVLRETRVARSSALYRQLAEKVSLETCTDRAFLKFKQTLQQWFPLVPQAR